MNSYQKFAKSKTLEYFDTLKELANSVDQISTMIDNMEEDNPLKTKLKLEQTKLVGKLELFLTQLSNGQAMIMDRM